MVNFITLQNNQKTVTLTFGRHGKLLKEPSARTIGWDLKKRQPLPTNDYWFKVIRENRKIYTGHFTLKR